MSPHSAQKNPAALQQLLESFWAQTTEPSAQAIVEDRTQLLRHCEAVLLEAAFRGGDGQMQSAAEVGSGERHGKGKAEARLVQLVDRDDHKGAGLGLLPAPRRFGICPVDVTLLRLWFYHSGADASKPDSSSSLSAR